MSEHFIKNQIKQYPIVCAALKKIGAAKMVMCHNIEVLVQQRSLVKTIKQLDYEKCIKRSYKKNSEFYTWDESITTTGRIAIYTCLYGGYDTLNEPAVHPNNVDYIAFTDCELPPDSLWQKRSLPDTAAIKGLSPQRLSRYAKILPHTVLSEYEYSIYLDANIKILGDLTPLIKAVGPVPIAFCWHSSRNCIFQEMGACELQHKEKLETLHAQAAAYRSAGMPEQFGMTENGFMIRKHNDPRCIQLMEIWWKEFLTHSSRDQLCLPFAMWKCGYTMKDFGFFRQNIRTNPLIELLYTHGETQKK